MSENGTATAPKLRHAIAEEVRVILARRRISATKLAQDLGWTQQYMSRRMVGDQPFDADDMERIALALGVEIIDLLPRDRRTPTLGYERYIDTYHNRAVPSGPPRRLERAGTGPPNGPRRTAPTGR